jgi:hypothetical protein
LRVADVCRCDALGSTDSASTASYCQIGAFYEQPMWEGNGSGTHEQTVTGQQLCKAVAVCTDAEIRVACARRADAAFWLASLDERTEVGQMTEKQSKSKAQREQQELLAEALRRPGVAATAEAYGRVEGYALTQSAPNTKNGYATGGNAA